MSNDLKIILFLLIINAVAAILYLVFRMGKKNRKKGFCMFFFLLAFPIVGILFLGCGEFIHFLGQRLQKKEINPDDLSFRKKTVKALEEADISKDLNKVPIEEALLMSGKEGRRNAFLDFLKREDFEESMPLIRKAVESEDTEVSHYAASFLSDTLAKYKNRELEYREAMNKEPGLESRKRYVTFMEELLSKDIFSRMEFRQYAAFFCESAESLYAESPQELSSHTLSMLVDLWRQLGDKEKADQWVAHARERCGEDLECFKLCAREYYRAGERDAFFRLLNDMKDAPLPLDYEALGWIRFFSDREERSAEA